MLIIGLHSTTLNAQDLARLAHPLVAGVILFARNYSDSAQLRALCQAIRAHAPHLLICVDHEGGRVQRFRDAAFTLLPEAAALGRIYDQNPELALKLAQACGQIMGHELRAHGIDFSLAPILDLQDDCSSVIGNRAFHTQPEAVSALSCALRRGLRAQGMAAVGKHYPGHGRVQGDSHHMLPCDTRPYDERAADRAPFAANIADGIEGIMSAHILLPEDRLPAGFSPLCLQALREQGFHGVIMSDDLDMQGALHIAADPATRVRMALAAGADVALICNRLEDIDAVLAAGLAVDASARDRLATLRAHPAAADADRQYADAKALLAAHYDCLTGNSHG